MLLAIILKVFQKEETKGFLNMSFNIAFGEWLKKKPLPWMNTAIYMSKFQHPSSHRLDMGAFQRFRRKII